MPLNFSRWYRCPERINYPGKQWPGICVVAKSNQHIAGTPVSIGPEIIYIGMTNSQYGLDGRLCGCASTIELRLRKTATLSSDLPPHPLSPAAGVQEGAARQLVESDQLA